MPDQEPIEGLDQEPIDVSEKVSIPFPLASTVYTFALTDPLAPDGISLRFDAPSEDTIKGWETETESNVAAKMSVASEAARGIGGNAESMALAARYHEAIKNQAYIELQLQRLLDKAVRLRYEMEILRQMSKA